jgi:hypothetical protein
MGDYLMMRMDSQFMNHSLNKLLFKCSDRYPSIRILRMLIKLYHSSIPKNVNSKINEFSRSAIIIMEASFHNSIRNEPCILLFKNSKWNKFTDTGGHIERKNISIDSIDVNNILIENAIREVREETLNTLLLKKDNIKIMIENQPMYIDFYNKQKRKFSRTYFVCIPTNCYCEGTYFYNKNLLKNTKEICWRETNDVTRFYISDLKKCLTNYNLNTQKDLICPDVNGRDYVIYSQTAMILLMASRKNILNIVLNHPINLVSEICTENNFLRGTQTLKA